jgi:hypothetical protein
MEGGEAHAHHAPRSAAHVRVADDRGERERQGTVDLHGAREHSITYDRYGHLMPGNEDEAAALLDAYLERANTKARIAQMGPA